MYTDISSSCTKRTECIHTLNQIQHTHKRAQQMRYKIYINTHYFQSFCLHSEFFFSSLKIHNGFIFTFWIHFCFLSSFFLKQELIFPWLNHGCWEPISFQFCLKKKKITWILCQCQVLNRSYLFANSSISNVYLPWISSTQIFKSSRNALKCGRHWHLQSSALLL